MRPTSPEVNKSTNPLKSQTVPVPQGFLAGCMVDADARASSRAGRARGRAIGISALAQACLLTLILIVPLLATSRLTSARNAMPIAPYGGTLRRGQDEKPKDTTRHTTEKHLVPPDVPIFRPPTNKNKAKDGDDDKTNVGPTDLIGPGSPWGTKGGDSDKSRIIQIPGAEEGPRPPLPEPGKKPPVNPVSVSEGAELAQLIHRVEPVYPRIAIYRHTEGTVQLRAVIARDGTVREVQVLSGDAILAFAAEEAVKQWRFRPTILNGQPVEVDTFFTVNFRIKQ